VLKNDISDDSSNDPLLEDADLFLASDNSIPPGIENVADDSEGDEEIDIVTNTDDVLPPGVENDDDLDGEVDAVEELHADNSISNSDNEESDFDNPSIP
nr:hypothetical protein [Tanacetum cinerariifolium]